MATSRKSRKAVSQAPFAKAERRLSGDTATTAQMPRGGMLAGETDGMHLAVMPGAVGTIGGMLGESGAMSDGSVTGQMPRGEMGSVTGVSVSGMPMGGMPAREMQTMSDTPGGSRTVPVLRGGMPLGLMSGEPAAAAAAVIDAAIEMPGLWRLTLNQVSGTGRSHFGFDANANR